METKLELLYGLLRHAVQLADTRLTIRQYDLPADIRSLLAKSENLLSQHEMFIRDVTEKFFQERYGILLGSSQIRRRTSDGRESALFVPLSVTLHPSSKLTENYSEALQLVYDIHGEYVKSGAVPNGGESYWDFDETKGDRLVLFQR